MADEKYESDFESDSEGDESLLDVSPDDVEMGEMIGGGGLGLVYAAKWKKKEVAVKMLFDPRVSEALIKEFRDEAMVQWGLNHPNIVKLYACCVKPPKMLMIFDKSDGSLFEVLHKQTYELRRSEAWEIALAVAKGMNHLHTHNPKIIHRDLKSHNLLVYKKDGKYDWSATKLCDFGLATVGARGAGTPCYMAPELHANKPYNEKVDVFAFGVLLCELVSLEVPFGGFTPFDIRSKVTKGERPPLSRTCPRPIEKLIKECWHDEPKRRPSFAQVMCRSRTSFFSCTSHLHSMTSRK